MLVHGTGTVKLKMMLERMKLIEDLLCALPGLVADEHVEVIVADDPDCIALMTRFITEKPELWAEDIAED